MKKRERERDAGALMRTEKERTRKRAETGAGVREITITQPPAPRIPEERGERGGCAPA